MNAINHFISASEELKQISGQDYRPCVVILGSFNSGKSTLLNSLLEEDVSPVGIIPTTSCLMHFTYGSTFKARTSGSGEKRVFHHKEQLYSFLAKVGLAGGRVDVEMPSGILKKCRLVDTPGIDSPGGDAGRLAEQAAAEADKIIYLFHQRGIEDYNRVFLYRLASLWKKKSLSDISFWINCNLGPCDGTSLETTRSALREIFLSQVRLNTINTAKRENVEMLRKFLEVELARDCLQHAAEKLKKMDRELPERLKKAARIRDDALFLCEFWKVRETARKVLEAEKQIYSVPSVLKEIDGHFNLINSSNLGTSGAAPGGRPYRPKAAGLKEIKKALLELSFSLLEQNELLNFVDRSKLTRFFRQVEEERFTVAAAGGFSTGKSTFFNAILKEKVLPAADGPTTASVTRIFFGRQKKATVYTPLQVTLQLFGLIDGKARLNTEALAALERWLAAPQSGIARLEICQEGAYRFIDRHEACTMAGRLRELFAAGGIRGSSGTAPAAYRTVSLKWLKGKRVPQSITVTFQNPGAHEFDLSTPEGKQSFELAVAYDNAFRIETVHIEYPSEYLKLADFIDTPGLDWIQKHHCEKSARYIRQSDAHLVFFNGKHILNQMDEKNFRNLFLSGTAGHLKQAVAPGGEEKLYFVINFADSLTPSQREAVYNFVRNNLSSPRIYLISALKALSGEDGGMNYFLKSLEEGILRYRGRAFYLAKLDELYSILDLAGRQVNGEITGRQPHGGEKNLRKAQELLRTSKRKLKEMRKTIYSTGG